MTAAQRFVAAFGAWVVVTAAVFFSSGLEVLVVLWLIGLLVARELAGHALVSATRARVDVGIGVGLVAFGVVVAVRVAEILGA